MSAFQQCMKDKGSKESCANHLGIAATADIDLNTKAKEGQKEALGIPGCSL